MQLLAALFIDDIELRPVDGPSTRIDLGGVQFSAAAPSAEPFPWAPHLAVIVHAPEDHSGSAVLEVLFIQDGEQVARNVQPLQVEPGKFNYRLVRAEIDITAPAVIHAHVRIDQDDPVIVPFTHLPPVD
ncbi:MAG: hypothetical protein HKN94_07325 [Acidimicrobiales bacterium]|nr:hypothetical protein [Acidimicrobiales bacterium]